jgi:hypothetical protein
VRLAIWIDGELKLIVFPFSLKWEAEEWLRSEPAGHFK